MELKSDPYSFIQDPSYFSLGSETRVPAQISQTECVRYEARQHDLISDLLHRDRSIRGHIQLNSDPFSFIVMGGRLIEPELGP